MPVANSRFTSMTFTYYGHSTFTIAFDGAVLLFDPFFTGNPKASETEARAVACDYLLISHGHSDHIADAVPIARRTGATVVSNFEIVNWMQRHGVNKTHPMNIGGSWTFGFGTVECVQAVHSSSFPDGTYAGNPMGFVVETDDTCLYYAGDTALTMDMKLLGAYRKIQYAFLPVGGNFTMNVDQALAAAGFIGCDRVVGLHFDTFDMIRIDHDEAIGKFRRAGKELILPEVGQHITF